GILYDTLCEYALNGNLPDNIPSTVRLAFNFISPVIDWDYAKFQDTVIRNQENGRKGGRPVKNPPEPKKPSGLSGLSEEPKETHGNPLEPKKPDSDSDSVSDSDNKKRRKKKTKVFTPPSLEEFKNYFFENEYPVELAERAFKGYEQNNWCKANDKPITNWKSTCINGWFKPENKHTAGNQQINGYQSQTEKAL
ncbi:MAG: DUF6291 domain-containing protein, partial [Mariniphaga sp.]